MPARASRKLPPIAHLFLDATYTKARLNGVITDCAVFVAAHIRSIFNAGSRKMANIMITNVLETFRADGQDKLANWLENNIEECLTVIDCPPEVQKRLKTSNFMESLNRQLKRRTNVISVFPSEASLLRIVTAKAMDLSDEWEGVTGKATISPEKLQQTAEVLKAASSPPTNSAA